MNNNSYQFDLVGVGRRIKNIRGDENQADFGRKIGLSQTKTSRLETGRTSKPSAELLFKICILNDPPVNLHWLITGEGSKYVGKDINVDPNTDQGFELLISQIRELKKEGDYRILGKIQELVESKGKKSD